MTRRGGRRDSRALAALLAILAIFTQALLPSAAMAASHTDRSGALIQICSAMGLKQVTAQPGGGDTRPKGFAGLPCADCVTASVAAVTPAAPSLPLRLRDAVILRAAIDANPAARPRAPPRVREQAPRAPPVI